MVRWEWMLRFLIALALVVSSVECAAACTPAACAPTQPPCHHHKQAPVQKTAGCHELIPATTVQSFAIGVTFASEPVESVAAIPMAPADFPVFENPSPPPLPSSFHSVLRI
jgi:hypothetical protein